MTRSDGPTCDSVRDGLADAGTTAAAPELALHLASCPRCARVARETSALGETLRALPAVALPAGFHARLQARLAAAAPARRAPVRLAGRAWLRAGLAFAAVVAVVAGLWLGRQRPPSVDAAERELVAVDVEVEAAVATPGVAIEITLPEGLAVESDDTRISSLHTLSWTTELAAGTNRFSLVLRADAVGDHRVHVALAADGRRAAVDLAVHVRPVQAHAWLGSWMRSALARGPAVHLELGGRS